MTPLSLDSLLSDLDSFTVGRKDGTSKTFTSPEREEKKKIEKIEKIEKHGEGGEGSVAVLDEHLSTSKTVGAKTVLASLFSKTSKTSAPPAPPLPEIDWSQLFQTGTFNVDSEILRRKAKSDLTLRMAAFRSAGGKKKERDPFKGYSARRFGGTMIEKVIMQQKVVGMFTLTPSGGGEGRSPKEVMRNIERMGGGEETRERRMAALAKKGGGKGESKGESERKTGEEEAVDAVRNAVDVTRFAAEEVMTAVAGSRLRRGSRSSAPKDDAPGSPKPSAPGAPTATELAAKKKADLMAIILPAVLGGEEKERRKEKRRRLVERKERREVSNRWD